MPDEQLITLKNSLKSTAMQHSSISKLQWVFAGSWHRKFEGNLQNLAPILDRYGKLIFNYQKSLPYRDNKVGIEDIKGSYCIPILVTENQLVAFAICLDFCEVGSQPVIPYRNLDVDLIAVSSLGNETTMSGHIANAVEVSKTYGTRVFVVQQPDKPLKDYAGYVLPALKKPDELSLKALLQSEWSLHKLD